MARSLSEHSEQSLVVAQLRDAGALCLSVPNEATKGRYAYAQRGLLPGAPDLLVLSPPPGHGARPWVGLAIEMKNAKGRASTEQSKVLARMAQLGWLTAVCKGSGEALRLLRGLGYPVGHIGPPDASAGPLEAL